MNQLYLHGKSWSYLNGWHSFWGCEVESKVTDMPRSGQTQTGYGKAIPTRYMVKFNGRWQRVYCCIYSNSGTLYIKSTKFESIIVRDYSA